MKSIEFKSFLNLDIGISWDSENKKWRLRRYIGKKVIRLPRFETRTAARKANEQLMKKHPSLVRYAVDPICGTCITSPQVRHVCGLHYQRIRKTGFRWLPHKRNDYSSGHRVVKLVNTIRGNPMRKPLVLSTGRVAA